LTRRVLRYVVPVVLLLAGRPTFAQGSGEAEGQGAPGEELRVESGQPEDSEYQLRGPADLATPEELMSGPSDQGGEAAPEDEEPTPEAPPTVEAEEEDDASLDLDLEEEEPGELPPVHPVEPEELERLRWLLVPPYYQAIRGNEGTRLVFPLFYQSWTAAGREQVLLLPFLYRSRGPAEGQGADVAFPFLWWLRSPERRTLVIGNVYRSTGETSSHTGIAPLIFWGNTASWSYQVGFPVYWRLMNRDGHGFTLAGLWFDHRIGEGEYRRGVFPLVWIGERQGRGYALGLPLVYHFWRHGEGSSTTVVPPLYVEQFADGYGFGLFPLIFYREREARRRLTLFPLFYYGSTGENRMFLSLAAWYRRTAEARMGGVLLYHWSRRRDSTFDALVPLYLHGANTRLGSSWSYIFPITYVSSDPVRRRTVVFPVVWDWENRHVSRTTAVMPFYLHYRNMAENRSTTWVLPTFQVSRRPDGYSFNIHPLLYLSSDADRSHSVVFPIWWRFERPTGTSTVAFPLYWDFARTRSASRFSVFFPVVWRRSSDERSWTTVLNVVYASGERQGVPYWSFQFWPLFRVARPAPDDIEWDVLLGLAGYGRRGDRRWVDVFWVPVEMGRPADGGAAMTATIDSEATF